MIADLEKHAETADERLVYFLIDQCGSFRHVMQRQLNRGNIPEASVAGVHQDIARAAQDQIYLVRHALPRFGIENALDEEGRPTETYWKWFRWWDAWKRGMPDEEWRNFDAAYARGLTPEEDRQYRPQGDWRDESAEALG